MQPSVLRVPTAAETNLLMGLSSMNERGNENEPRVWSAIAVCVAALRRSTAGGQLTGLTFGLDGTPTI
jgi:hypothetical protein